MKQGAQLRKKLEDAGWVRERGILFAPLGSMYVQERIFEADDLRELLDDMLSRRQRILALSERFPEESRVALTDVEQVLKALREILE